MTTQNTEAVTATASLARGVIARAKAPQPALSVYLKTSANDVLSKEARLRLLPVFDGITSRLEATPLQRTFADDRERVEAFLGGLQQPGGPALALFSGGDTGLTALWMPMAIDDQVRYGRGLAVLPLIDLLDELEPVGVAFMASDHARFLAVEAGRLTATERMEWERPSRSKALVKPTFDRALESQAAQVGKRFAAFAVAHAVGRVFIAGTPGPRAALKAALTPRLLAQYAGDLSVPGYGSDAGVVRQAVEAARRAERLQESQFVADVVTRGEKHQGAVLGPAAVLGAIEERTVHTVVRAPDAAQQARYSPADGLLLPEESVRSPASGLPTIQVTLDQELPPFALSRGATIEVVHGPAAQALAGYGGIAATLRAGAP